LISERLVAGLIAVGAAILLAILLSNRRNTQIDPEQSWFWEPEWLQGEVEAETEIAAGGGQVFESTDQFLDHLDKAASERV
jgi:hypothetical protein